MGVMGQSDSPRGNPPLCRMEGSPKLRCSGHVLEIDTVFGFTVHISYQWPGSVDLPTDHLDGPLPPQGILVSQARIAQERSHAMCSSGMRECDS